MESRVFKVFFAGCLFSPFIGNTVLDHQMNICFDLLLPTSMTCILGGSVFVVQRVGERIRARAHQ